MTIKIKNWSEFQHYRERSPIWIKLYRRLLDDPQFHSLSGDAAKTLILLWCLAAEDKDNCGNLPDSTTIAFRLRIDSKTLSNQLSELNHWVECDASNTLACGYQNDSKLLEQRREETEKETEKRERVDIRAQAREPKPKRKTILPADWQPNEAHANLSRDLGVDLSVQDEAFRDYEAAHRRTMADWDACFRTWLRKSAEFQRSKPKRKQEQVPMYENLNEIFGRHIPDDSSPPK